MKKEIKYIFFLVLILGTIYFLKPTILKVIGWSYKDIYNANITVEEIENMQKIIDALQKNVDNWYNDSIKALKIKYNIS